MVEPILWWKCLGTIFISILGLIVFRFGQFLTSTRLAALALIPAWVAIFFGTSPQAAPAYPVFASQLHASPLDATQVVVTQSNTRGHMPNDLPALPEWTPGTVVIQPKSASLSCRLSAPHSIFPDSIFDVVGSKPADGIGRQISSGGDTAALNVGGVIALPEELKLAGAADSALTIAFNSTNANDIVFGPQPGQLYSSVVISCQSERKDLPFSKYPLIAGGNRGRGQIYPDGKLSNSPSFGFHIDGVTVRQHFARGGSFTDIACEGRTGEINIQHFPAGPTLAASHAPGAMITYPSPITGNPNVGGFGQADSPARILYHTSESAVARSFSLGTSGIVCSEAETV